MKSLAALHRRCCKRSVEQVHIKPVDLRNLNSMRETKQSILHNIRKYYFKGIAARTLLVVSILLLSSCDEGSVEEAIWSCLDGDGPSLPRVILPTATINEEYSATIKASIKRSENDDLYEYTFTVSEDLPYGIEANNFEGNRDLYLSGTAVQAGSYQFEVIVRVNDINIESLCLHQDTRSYILSVHNP